MLVGTSATQQWRQDGSTSILSPASSPPKHGLGRQCPGEITAAEQQQPHKR